MNDMDRVGGEVGEMFLLAHRVGSGDDGQWKIAQGGVDRFELFEGFMEAQVLTGVGEVIRRAAVRDLVLLSGP